MRKFRLGLLVGLGALALPLFAASAAQADEYSCAFEGAAGPIAGYFDATNEDPNGIPNSGDETDETGIESIMTDIAQGDEGDSLFGDPLTDTDNGNDPAPLTPGEDGSYSFSTNPVGSVNCLFVEDTIGPNEPTMTVLGMTVSANDTGLYTGTIESNGEYDNVVCGTGLAIDDDTSSATGAFEETKVTLNPNGADTAASITDPDGDTRNNGSEDTTYEIDFAAGDGAINITSAYNSDGENGQGAGTVHIDATASVNTPMIHPCVDGGSVIAFDVTGAFTGSTS